ncbi:MAG: cryptochrome/photolyase family protein [bacterium]
MTEMTHHNPTNPLRHLVVVLGDQLDRHASAFDGFDPSQDAVWMAEVWEEAEHVWSSKARIVMFLSAMRHFAASLRNEGITLYYRGIDDPENRQGLAAELAQRLRHASPQKLIITEPGEFRVKRGIHRYLQRAWCAVGHPAGSGLPVLARGIRRTCLPAQTTAHGVLLPGDAKTP